MRRRESAARRLSALFIFLFICFVQKKGPGPFFSFYFILSVIANDAKQKSKTKKGPGPFFEL
jgi:hypothetical protein